MTVGGDLIDRDYGDSWSNFTIGLTDQVLPEGTITGWNTYIEAINGDANTDIALLVLRNFSADLWHVVGSDLEQVSGTGLQSGFDANIDVLSGDVLAIWMDDAKVSFDQSAEDVNWSNGGNQAWSAAPTVGSLLNLDAGAYPGNGQRTYSLQATVNVADVAEPASLSLLGLGLIGLAATRRRVKAA